MMQPWVGQVLYWWPTPWRAVQEAAWRALNTPFAPNYSVVFLSARDHTPISVSACSSHNRMSISRYIVVEVVRCSLACSHLPVRR